MEVQDAWLGESLLYVLRERLGLPGSKGGCEQGECGSCSVDVDGRAGVRLPGAGGERGRPRDHHRRGPGPRAGRVHRRAAGVRRRGRGAVRLLHPGPRHGGARPPRPDARLRPTSRCARRSRATCAGAPATGACFAAVEAAVDVRAAQRLLDETRHDRHRPPASRTGVRPGRLGTSAARPDSGPKVRGEFAFSNDLWADGMLWGATLRSPHAVGPHPRRSTRRRRGRCPASSPSSRPRTCPARRSTGSSTGTSPCSRRRSSGTPASRSPRWPPTTPTPPAGPSPRSSSSTTSSSRSPTPRRRSPGPTSIPTATRSATSGSARATRRRAADRGRGHLRDRHAGPGVHGPRGRARHTGRGRRRRPRRVDPVAAQRRACRSPSASAWRPSRCGSRSAAWAVRSAPARTSASRSTPASSPCGPGRPVKMVYSREESFLGHVHRHPARIWMRHTAEPDGTIVSFEARIVLDGGAYRSSSYHVVANASCFAAGPYNTPNAVVEGIGVRTNNPPCGAMRGFGAVQVCFAHEAQMDKLADGVRRRPDRAAAAQRDGAGRHPAHRSGGRRHAAHRRGDPGDGRSADARRRSTATT